MPKIEVKEIHPQTKLPLDLAVPIVNAAIEKYRKKLEYLAVGTSENDPIMVEGLTTADYQVQMMVDPKEVAKILLDWEYPTYKILEDDAPEGMWEELGQHFGLSSVNSFDL